MCAECKREDPPFLVARALGPYAGVLRRGVHRLKYGRKRYLGELFGRLLAELIRDDTLLGRAEAIVPVPLYDTRRRARGFNQAEVLARTLAAASGLPLFRDVLLKIRRTEPQTGLPRELRRENLKGAFAVGDAKALRGRRVLLVDDVFTTGATVTECSRVLLLAGAEAVMVVTVAGADVRK